jgi:hypothetical protein
MSNFNLSPVAAACGAQASVFSDAASAEHNARDRWVKAAKVGVKAGVTVAMLTKGTEKAPNPQFDQQVWDVIRNAIIAGVSASKKGMKFSAALPGAAGAELVSGKMHTWTVADLLKLTRDQLRDIDDDVLKTQRRTYMQMVDGTLMGLIRRYIDRIENPDKPRGVKGEKNSSAAADKDAPLLDRMHVILTEFNAQVLALKDDNGKTLGNVLQMHEAGLQLIALIGQNRAK